ncbi:hypothetical protein C2U70_24220 [Bradyrhizobium guangdongense]|nr:hypothetical protein C2U70_24220 [Bradyrhizobium guangdongense]
MTEGAGRPERRSCPLEGMFGGGRLVASFAGGGLALWSRMMDALAQAQHPSRGDTLWGTDGGVDLDSRDLPAIHRSLPISTQLATLA